MSLTLDGVLILCFNMLLHLCSSLSTHWFYWFWHTMVKLCVTQLSQENVYINNICSSFIAFATLPHVPYFQCSTALHINNKKDSSSLSLQQHFLPCKCVTIFFFHQSKLQQTFTREFLLHTFNSSSTFYPKAISQFIKCCFRCLSCFYATSS